MHIQWKFRNQYNFIEDFMKTKTKKTRKSTTITDAENFVNAINKKDNIKAKEYLSKIVQKKCKTRFKQILSAEKDK